MSVGNPSITLTVNTAARRLSQSAYPQFRNLVNLTISGAGVAAGNLALIVYRGATVVASAVGFTGSTSSAASTMDLNTTAMLAVMSGVEEGAIRSFNMSLYDTVTLERIARGVLNVLGMSPYSAVDADGAVPVASSGLYQETIDGIAYFVLKDAQGVVYAKFPAPGATPDE